MRARAEAALGCSRLSVRGVGGGGYLATGCGHSLSYTCATERRGWGFGSHLEVLCAPDGEPQAAPTPARPPPRSGVAETPSVEPLGTRDARVALDALAGCADAFASGSIIITIATSGEVTRVETPDVAIDAATCITQALRRAHFDIGGDVRHGSVPGQSGPPTAAVPSTAGDALARAYVEAHRDLILACTGTTAAAVIAVWTADGALIIGLPDAQAGTAQDECVRASTSGGVLTPSPGVAGSVLHAVH